MKLKKVKCQLCGYEITNTQINNHTKKCNGLGPHKIRNKKGRGKNWMKGKTYVEEYGEKRAKEICEILSRNRTGSHIGKCKDEKSELKRKEKISKRMIGNINWIRSGKGKRGTYKGYFYMSSWELAYIFYNLEHHIEFKRNWERFDYVHNNKPGKYIPDFIENDTYIEIKGYKTSVCISKINHFPKKIVILYYNEMQPYLKYVIEKHGKNFHNVLNEGFNKAI